MTFNKGLIFSSLLVGLISCQQKKQDISPISVLTQVPNIVVIEDSLNLRPTEGLVYHKEKPFSGTSIAYFENGVEAVRIDYLNGKKHGLYQKWFEDGTLSFESQYVKGKQHGNSKTWWKNGQLRSESSFENGVAHGLQLQWYQSGAKFKRRQLVEGREEGLQQSWRENGKLYNNYEAKNGRIFGLKRANLCYKLEDEEIQYGDK